MLIVTVDWNVTDFIEFTNKSLGYSSPAPGREQGSLLIPQNIPIGTELYLSFTGKFGVVSLMALKYAKFSTAKLKSWPQYWHILISPIPLVGCSFPASALRRPVWRSVSSALHITSLRNTFMQCVTCSSGYIGGAVP